MSDENGNGNDSDDELVSHFVVVPYPEGVNVGGMFEVEPVEANQAEANQPAEGAEDEATRYRITFTELSACILLCVTCLCTHLDR